MDPDHCPRPYSVPRMNESEFIARWESECSDYEAWGRFVTETITRELEAQLAPQLVGYFLKIPPKPRVKELRSLLDKAFYRNKSYDAPYGDITDKVGVRFVVLLSTDIDVVCSIIESSPLWSASRDRDFERERDENPEFFGYQSVHFVVRAARDIRDEEITFHEGMPCEVQIRTLLQHAHSELTHDTIYKPKTMASSLAKRYCARSMALIEATDDFFLKVVEEIKRAGHPLEVAMELLERTYKDKVGLEPDISRVNTLILDAFVDKLVPQFGHDLSGFLSGKPYVLTLIAEHAPHQLLFRQPAVLLLYYLASVWPRDTKRRWPLTPDELRPIYDDIGQNFDI